MGAFSTEHTDVAWGDTDRASRDRHGESITGDRAGGAKVDLGRPERVEGGVAVQVRTRLHPLLDQLRGRARGYRQEC